MSAHLPAVHTWILTDGHAGNLRQAVALAGALGLTRAISRVVRPPAPWRWLAPRYVPGAHHALAAVLGDIAPPALAIGCGRQAALATRLLRRRGVSTVQILDPRLDPRHWDLVIAPAHDGLTGANVISLLGSLNPVDAAWLAQARQAHPAPGQLPGPRTALLLGGDTRHRRYTLTDFHALADRLDAALGREGDLMRGSLLATTSRRTPAAVQAALRQRYNKVPGLIWCGPEDGPNPYPGRLAWADRIVCTADSANLLSEACATAVPVFVADPQTAPDRLGRLLQALSERGRIQPLDAAGLADFPAVPLQETARVAAQVRARLVGRLPGLLAGAAPQAGA